MACRCSTILFVLVRLLGIICLNTQFPLFLNAMDAGMVVPNTSPVQLRVKAIAKLPLSEVGKALGAAVDSVKLLLAINVADNAYLIRCYQVLKGMCSFEYLDNGDLLKVANELNALLYILKKDDNIRLYCMDDQYADFRERLRRVFHKAANLAFEFNRKRLVDQAKLQQGLALQVKAINDELKSIIVQCYDILKCYSNLLIEDVRKAYRPLDDFLSKFRDYKSFDQSLNKSITEAAQKPVAAISYASIANKLADQQKQQQEQLILLKETAISSKKRFELTKPALCSALGGFQGKVHLLHNSAICKHMSLARLPDPVIINSFFYLLTGEKNSLLSKLLNNALQRIPRNLQEKLLMVLQLYICESYFPDTAQSAQGRIWEIAVALFLHDSKILRDLGKDVTQAGKKFAREFDVSFGDPEILADCKAITDWDYWYPKTELANPSTENKKVRQINDQSSIAASRRQHCCIISKYPIPQDHKVWLQSKNVLLITPEDRILMIALPDQEAISISFEQLYSPSYCFEF